MSHVTYTCEWVMSHVRMSHVAYARSCHVSRAANMNESWHMYMWISHVSYMNESCCTCVILSCLSGSIYEWVMSQIHLNESCLVLEWVMSHIPMRHVTHMHESCYIYECGIWTSHIWMSHVTYMNTSCRTCAIFLMGWLRSVGSLKL